MIPDPNGLYTARTPEQLQEILQMALGQAGPTTRGNIDLGLDSPVVAAATSFLPGVNVSGPVTTAAGPASTAFGYGTPRVVAGAKTASDGILSQLNNLRKGYEEGISPLVKNQTKAIQGLIPQGPVAAKGGLGMKIARFGGQALKNPAMQMGMKYAPVIGTALSVGDLVLGDESLANKGMDAAFMAAGGAIGSVVPVVGTGLGIAAGKLVSDGTQFLFGDKKSPEQRRMEEALIALRGGQI